MSLPESEEAGRREGEYDSGGQGTGRADADSTREKVSTGACTDAGDEQHHIQRKEGIPGRSEPRGTENCGSQQVLRIGERVGRGEEDVGLKQRPGLAHQRMDVPGQGPEEETSIGP